MEISVVIRCGDDPRVFDCIDSVDEDVDIIVSTSENVAFEKLLKERGIRYCLSPRKNLSLTSNIGFEHAIHDKVIITDSDTVFEKGCIRKMFYALDNYKIVRSKLKFDVSKKIASSKLVAGARDFVNSKELAFTPGIGVRKDLLDDIGGFLFNDVVPFAVDADLNYRVKRSGVKVGYLKDAVITHCAESILHDLKAAKRIGSGVRISSESLSTKYGVSKKSIRRSLKAVHSSDYIKIIRTKGLFTFFYQILWDTCYHIGSISRKIGRRTS